MLKPWHSHIGDAEWEALCDGCGKCCMHKFEDEDTGEIWQTRVACRLLDIDTCRCTRYEQRLTLVSDCLDIRKMSDAQMVWLPETCAYRLLFEGKPLPDWHPLNTGDASSTAKAGHAMCGTCVSETDVAEADIPDYILTS